MNSSDASHTAAGTGHWDAPKSGRTAGPGPATPTCSTPWLIPAWPTPKYSQTKRRELLQPSRSARQRSSPPTEGSSEPYLPITERATAPGPSSLHRPDPQALQDAPLPAKDQWQSKTLQPHTHHGTGSRRGPTHQKPNEQPRTPTGYITTISSCSTPASETRLLAAAFTTSVRITTKSHQAASAVRSHAPRPHCCTIPAAGGKNHPFSAQTTGSGP